MSENKALTRPVICGHVDLKILLVALYSISILASIVFAWILKLPTALLNGLIAPFALRGIYKGNSRLLHSAYIVNTFFSILTLIFCLSLLLIRRSGVDKNTFIPDREFVWATAFITSCVVAFNGCVFYCSRSYTQYLDRLEQSRNKNKIASSIQS
eukprot:NODE_817_length_3729_cov_0.988154.p4 type:complete len:155 gc:universal NODE_817_length_3729_cov_0.988154:1737-1273(-)